MTLAEWLLVVMWAGLTLYALLGGADFGGGFWDLVAGGDRKGMPRRKLIEHAIGPVWEANHVWLIFVLVLLWTGFPRVFAAVSSTLYIPLTLAAFGIIARGAAFAFRKASTQLWQQRLFGAAFAISSVFTPFFLGTIVGGIASGRVPAGIAQGDLLTSWWNPTSILGGILAVGVTAYLAAVFLTGDAARTGKADLVEVFRRKALVTGVVMGLAALGGIGVLRADAPTLYRGLTSRALPLIVISAVAGLASLALLWVRRLMLVRLTAVIAVTAVMWGWAVGQYPLMLPPEVTISSAAASAPVLTATLGALGIGALLLLPSLLWLFILFQREHTTGLHPQART